MDADQLRGYASILEDELDTLYAILRELLVSIEEQVGIASDLDPTDKFVRAMRDARSWVMPPRAVK